jgi:hypothetical protein
MMINKKSFTNDGDCWSIKGTGIFFLGKEVEINIDTKTDSEEPLYEIYDDQIQTLNIILPKWEELAKQVLEGILEGGHVTEEELNRVVNNPKIWLGMDYKTKRPWGNNKWSVVVGVIESEDFGWHIEFEGTEFIEAWAGG